VTPYTLRQHLIDMNACDDAVAWVGERRSLQKAWDECPRGDWLLWYAARAGADHKTVVMAACACARLSLVHVPDGEDRPRLAIEAAEAWGRGDVGLDVVRAAAADAYAYAYAYADALSAASSAYAAADAAYAAYAAYADAYAAADAAAYAAAYAAYAYAYAYADADADAAADAATLAECADIVRQHIPTPPTQDDQ